MGNDKEKNMQDTPFMNLLGDCESLWCDEHLKEIKKGLIDLLMTQITATLLFDVISDPELKVALLEDVAEGKDPGERVKKDYAPICCNASKEDLDRHLSLCADSITGYAIYKGDKKNDPAASEREQHRFMATLKYGRRPDAVIDVREVLCETHFKQIATHGEEMVGSVADKIVNKMVLDEGFKRACGLDPVKKEGPQLSMFESKLLEFSPICCYLKEHLDEDIIENLINDALAEEGEGEVKH